MSTPVLDHVRDLAMSLTPEEQLKLISEPVSQLQGTYQPPARKIFPSLRGALADLGPAPSAEEIDEARREAWASLPREDVG